MPTKRATKKSTPRVARKSKSIRKTKGKQEPTNFEHLENRQLMSTVSVAQYGHDSNALQAAINASHDGDTILFDGGSYNISDTFTLAPNRTYLGQNGANLNGHGSDGEMLKIEGNNVTVKGLTLNGGGIFIDAPGNGFNNGITIDTVRVNMNTSGNNTNGITFTSGLQNSTINNCYFTGYNGGGFGIYGYNYQNLKITNNSFVNVTAGMHIDAFYNSGNLLVQANFISGVHGMGLEFQDTATNLQFLDNWFEYPNLSTNFATNNNCFAYSLILDNSTNITIKRNTIIAPNRPDGTGCRLGFELGGDNSDVEDNYVNGINAVAGMTDGRGSASVTFANNNIQNYLISPVFAFPASNRSFTTFNNNANVQLSWDINRGKPGANSAVGGTATGVFANGGTGGGTTTPTNPTTPTDPTTPSAPVPDAPTGLTAVATGTSQVQLFWNNVATTETGYAVYSTTDGSNWTKIATTAANATNFTATGLVNGTKYSFKVYAFNDNGLSKLSNIDTATPAAPHLTGTYISDMTWTGSTNAYGAAERDRSNGEGGDSDGHQISIAGVNYAKGVGVHGLSEIDIDLSGSYSTFLANVGVDDEKDGKGSVVFQVWVDGVKKYDSGMVTAGTMNSVSVDVSGGESMKLIVTQGTDGGDSDHGDWGNARLKKALTTGTGNPGGGGGTGGGTTTGDTVNLSDLKPSRAINGWGPVETNTSNGEQNAGDGHTMSINGKTYTTGLGVNAYSEIHYQLDGKYGNFITDLGVDDETNGLGTVDFQVWADGVKLFDSGTMTGGQNAQSIDVNVQGRSELVLVVTDAGDDAAHDHADWAGAKLTAAPRPSTVDRTYLSDLNGSKVSGTVDEDSSLGNSAGDDNLITLGGRTYGKGLGVSGGTRISYNLAGKYSTFITDLGIDDEVADGGSVTFQIWGDGKELFDSGKMTGASATKTAVVSVDGVKKLWLVVTDAGNGKVGDHADWANAQLIAA